MRDIDRNDIRRERYDFDEKINPVALCFLIYY